MLDAKKNKLLPLIITSLLFVTAHAETPSKKKSPPVPVSISKQVGSVKVQFDLVRVVVPNRIVNANNPPTWRAYFPICPQGTHYVSGVRPNLLPLDQGTYYAYCKCICFNQCGQLPGVTSTGGKAPLYTAKVTCETNVQGWFNSNLFTSARNLSGRPINFTPTPHQYFYCQSGNCHTNPLPSELGVSVPVGGYANTDSVNFEACTVAYKNNQCVAPDPSALGKQTIY